MGSAGREDLREFGLLPSDLLRRQQGFLLVEGQHDLIVWDVLLGEELRDLRLELLPMRGAGRLKSTLDSRVLYEFTDAQMFVVLDALDTRVVEAAWIEACRLAKIESPQRACDHVIQALANLRNDESQALSSFMTRALELGLEQRHTPLTLSATDVLDYLPVEAFVPGAVSWPNLRQELETSQAGVPLSGSRFKKWLERAKGADLSDQHIRHVAGEMDAIPEEFTRLLEEMRLTLGRGDKSRHDTRQDPGFQ